MAAATASTPAEDDASGEFNFLEDGAMKELAEKMDLIDQQLADLTNGSSASNIRNSTVVSNIAEFSQADLDYNEDAEGLSSLQDELNAVQEAANHIKEETEARATVAAAEQAPAVPDENKAPTEPTPAPTPTPAAPPAKAEKEAAPPQPATAAVATPSALVGGKPHKKIIATCVKPEPTSKVGISMKTSKGVTVIVSINSEGLMYNSTLMPGHKLVKVNGIEVKNARHARVIIQSAASKVVVEVLEEIKDEAAQPSGETAVEKPAE